jgi:prolyl-tRNA synthetase
MGGSGSEEFLVVSPSGEAWMAQCQSCGYAANVEAAEARVAPFEAPSGPVEAVHTPQQRTIQEVTAFLELPPQRLMKSLLYMTVEGPLMALIRGDHELSESALASVVGSVPLAATPEVIEEVTGAQAGFIGPQGLDDGVRIVADLTLEGTHGLVTGANQDDYHVVGLEPGRDFRVDGYYPLREVQSGDACVRCGAPIEVLAAIELGHIFNLGTKYSDALGAKFLDANGERRSIVMGSYGIGIERMVAAAIEEHSDDAGIVWPLPLAPYAVHILPINWAHDETRRVAMELDRTLSAQGLSCLLDDRELRAGVKFADADLLGMPLRVTIGERALGRGEIELRVRKSFEMTTVPIVEAADRVRAMLERLDAGEDS